MPMLRTVLAASSLLLIAGCAGSSSTETSNMTIEPSTLQATLAERQAAFSQRADDATKRDYAEGIQAVRDARTTELARTVGDSAPLFALPDHTGRSVALRDVLDRGPAIVVWYRGGWCPYCNLTLAAYQPYLEDIRRLGGTLIAISPELPDQTAETVTANGLDFVVLSDLGNQVARDYGIVFDLTPAVHRRFNAGFGLDAHNGQESGQLPLAATYVIDTDGRITWAFLDADYRKRAEPSEVIHALRAASR